MTFLVALGIGAMSGSCLFILLPHTFNIARMNEEEYLQKCVLIAGAIYTFFAVDRLLQCILEFKRRRQHHTAKIHAATLDSVTNRKPSIIARKTRANFDQEVPMKMYPKIDKNSNEENFEAYEKEQIRDEIDVSNYTNTFARSVSLFNYILIKFFSYQLENE